MPHAHIPPFNRWFRYSFIFIFFFSSICDVYLHLIPVLTVGRIANGCAAFIGLCWCCRSAELLSQSQIISICNRLLDMSYDGMTTGFIQFFPSRFHFFGNIFGRVLSLNSFRFNSDFFFFKKWKKRNTKNHFFLVFCSYHGECCRINFNHMTEKKKQKIMIFINKELICLLHSDRFALGIGIAF